MNTGNFSHHEMVVEQTFEDGSQEWYCPVCGRRFIMQWPPAYSKIILEVGDEQALHTGGLEPSFPSSTEYIGASYEANEMVVLEDKDPSLEPFLAFLTTRQDLDL